MRFIHCVLFSTLLLACQEQLPGAGEAYKTCRVGVTWTGPCNEGLRCVDNTCLPCGHDGEICCAIAGGDQNICNSGSGVACDDMIDKIGTCTTTCGSPGLACCDYDTCPNGGDCENGMCTGTPNPPGGGGCATWEEGDTKHLIHINTADCGTGYVIVYTATLEEAEACRQEVVNLAAPGEEVCDLNVVPTTLMYCDNNTQFPPAVGHELSYCSDTKLQACKDYWCADCNWSQGECP